MNNIRKYPLSFCFSCLGHTCKAVWQIPLLSSLLIFTGCTSNQSEPPFSLHSNDFDPITYHYGLNVQKEFCRSYEAGLYTLKEDARTRPLLTLEYNPDLFNYIQEAQAVLTWEQEEVRIPVPLLLVDAYAPEITVQWPAQVNGQQRWDEIILAEDMNDAEKTRIQIPFLGDREPDYSTAGWIITNESGKPIVFVQDGCQTDLENRLVSCQTLSILAWDGHGNFTRKELDPRVYFQTE